MRLCGVNRTLALWSLDDKARLCRLNQWRRNEFESGRASARSESGGGEHRSRRKIFLGRAPPLLALKAQLAVLVSVFVLVSTVWSVSCLLLYLWYPRTQPFVKVGAPAPVPHGVDATWLNTEWSKKQWRFSVEDLEGGAVFASPPPFGRRTDAVTHGIYS